MTDYMCISYYRSNLPAHSQGVHCEVNNELLHLEDEQLYSFCCSVYKSVRQFNSKKLSIYIAKKDARKSPNLVCLI